VTSDICCASVHQRRRKKWAISISGGMWWISQDDCDVHADLGDLRQRGHGIGKGSLHSLSSRRLVWQTAKPAAGVVCTPVRAMHPSWSVGEWRRPSVFFGSCQTSRAERGPRQVGRLLFFRLHMVGGGLRCRSLPDDGKGPVSRWCAAAPSCSSCTEFEFGLAGGL